MSPTPVGACINIKTLFSSHDYAWIPHNQAEPFDLDSMPEKRQLNIKDKKQAVMHSDGIAEAIEWITDKSKWTFPDYNTQPSQDSDTESQYVESQLAESEEEEGEKEEEEEEEVETPPPTKKRKVIAIEPPKNELKKVNTNHICIRTLTELNPEAECYSQVKE